jgi:hypothetical protein
MKNETKRVGVPDGSFGLPVLSRYRTGNPIERKKNFGVPPAWQSWHYRDTTFLVVVRRETRNG